MSQRTLQCVCGHTWVYSAAGPLPDDLRRICPACRIGFDPTLVRTPFPSQPLDDKTELKGLAGSEETNPIRATPRGSSALKPGTVLAGFEILDEINRGGMGVIYRARQQGLNRLVALKMIAPEQFGETDALKRFQREVQAAALLNHPNIVTVFHTDLSGPLPYLAMEYVPGIDLYRLVHQAGPLSVADACRYVKQAAQGLQHAYENGLVHRDIKPANLMVTPNPLEPAAARSRRPPLVKILDMGLARVTTPSNDGPISHLTQKGEFLGTPDFISPEQAQDPRQADTRSDLFSLGCTLFFLLTGEVPFPGENLMQKLVRQMTEPPPSLAAKRPDAPAGLVELIAKLMARNPADRHQTPTELADALDAALREPAAPVRPTPTPTPPAEPTVGTAKAATPRSFLQVTAHFGGVRALSLSADGQRLLSGGIDESLRLWEAGKLRELRALTDDVGPVNAVGLGPGAKWAASCALRLFQQDMVVQLWDLASGTLRRRLKGPTKDVRSLAISADGRKVAAGGDDYTVRVWVGDQPAVCLKGHSGTVHALAFLSDGAALLSASEDGTVRLWDLKTNASKGTIQPQIGPVAGVAFSGPGKRVAMAGREGLRLRHSDGRLVPLLGHRGPVLCVAFSPDGKLLASGGADHAVRLWRADDGEELTAWEVHGGPVHSVALAPDARFCYSGSADGTLCRWTVPS